MGYLYLTLAIFGEILGTNLLKTSNGFTIVWATIASLISYGACFYFLSLAMRSVDLNVAYAIWAGLGIVLVTVLGVVVWKQPINFASLIGIVLILIGVVILNLFGNSH